MPSVALRAAILIGTLLALSLISSLVLGKFNIFLGGAIPFIITFVVIGIPSRELVADVIAVIESEFADPSRPRVQSSRGWLIAAAGVVVLMLALAVLKWPESKPAAVPVPETTAVERPVELENILPQPSNEERLNEYSAIAQVSGIIYHLHPDLKPGEVFPKETVLVRIDAEDLELSIRRAEAELATLSSGLETLDAEASVVQKTVELRQQEDVDPDERLRSITERQIEDLKQQLEGIANRRRLSESRVATVEQELAQQRARLERTAVFLPVDVRIDAVMVEQDEFVAAGAVLIKATEINGPQQL